MSETFWTSPQWLAYERVCGVPVPRAQELAAADWETQVVDLARDEAVLWQDVRKSYHSLIHRHEDEVRHVGPASAVEFAERIARTMHMERAGRETRPFESWTLMGEWARDGLADFWTVRQEWRSDKFSAYVFVILYGDWAYYASGVSLGRSLAHALLWTAIRSLKARRVRWFELGWLARASDTDKDRAISFFKTGFGGKAWPANAVARGFQ